MSWISFRTRKDLFQVKLRSQMRLAEEQRRVRVLDIGLAVIASWSDEDLGRYG
jgi:hypothetical protein